MIIPSNGHDDFKNAFDFYEWSAPLYQTPKEVTQAIKDLNLTGRTIVGISIIGAARSIIQHTGYLASRVLAAGIELDDCWWEGKYSNYKDILIPWEISICEPVQLVFNDGCTLEILPVGNGGARIGWNTIPQDLKEGLNHSDFDVKRFFNECIGKEIKRVDFLKQNTRSYDWSEYSLKYWAENSSMYPEENVEPQEHDCYEIHLHLNNPYCLKIKQSDDSWYRVCMEGDYYPELGTVKHERFLESYKPSDKVVIEEDGAGEFGIFACYPRDYVEKDRQDIETGVGLNEVDLGLYLYPFLVKYYNPSIQENNTSAQTQFAWYGSNYYTKDSIRCLLNDLNSVIQFLEEQNQEGRIQDETLLQLENDLYTHEKYKIQEYSGEELKEYKKHQREIAVDFYVRFVKRMEHLLELPDRDRIVFIGP